MLPFHISVAAIGIVFMIIFYFCPLSVLVLGVLCADAYYFQRKKY